MDNKKKKIKWVFEERVPFDDVIDYVGVLEEMKQALESRSDKDCIWNDENLNAVMRKLQFFAEGMEVLPVLEHIKRRIYKSKH